MTTESRTPPTKGPTSTGKTDKPSPTTMVSPTTSQGTISGNKLRDPLTTPVQGATAISKTENPTTASVKSPTVSQGIAPTDSLKNLPSTSQTPPSPPQHISSSASTTTPKANPTTASTITTQKTTPPVILGSLAATTTANAGRTHAVSPTTSSRHLVTPAASDPGVGTQESQPSGQLTSTNVTAGVPSNNLLPGPPTSTTKELHSSSSSPVQGSASPTRSGSSNTSVSPPGGSVPRTTSKTPSGLPPGSSSSSEAAVTTTTRAEHKSHDVGSVSTKSTSADQNPASTQPSTSAPRDQTVSSSHGHQHPNISLPNQVICEDQVQNNHPTLHLKEAKTCAEWNATSAQNSFFESFCSTSQRAFNASREACTVTLTSHEHRSQVWAVRAVVHFPLDPEQVLEELKEKKDKLEELGIANITYDKMEREMVITDEFSTPLIITIVTLAGSLLLIAAIYGCCHPRFSPKKDQHIHPDLPGFDDGHVALIFNRLTEELQTMENGYHDNPTLEVMETSSEMQEKKVNLNGELGDSWIVPLDTIMKEDLEEEEDTHL
ncbi:PREDICTED: podocalyxin [Apaloderma vittatum]|uniref:podocalyxin n=1 Tax=Apaloderma vittatum TaxID=57397 RepID=UPI00052187A2|nr:PREDICTED: podocalyxin [Apaloderma vittatum]